MTIYIYGDSFGADLQGWPSHLEKLRVEKVKSECICGTGPNMALRFLIKDLENDKMKTNDSIILLLSDAKRLEFPFLIKNGDTDGAFRLANDTNWDHPIGQEKTEYLKKFSDKINTIAKTLGPMFLYETVKNVTFLHLLSLQFKELNFLVFTCFSLDNYILTYKHFNVKSKKLLDKLKFDDLNTDNFTFFRIPLSHIVGNTNENEIDLNNHMSKKQNLKFANMVDDLLNHREIDTSWFADEVYDNLIDNMMPREPMFIYD